MEHPDSEHPIPDGGSCRTTFQDTVDDFVGIQYAEFFTQLGDGACRYDESTDSLVFPDACGNFLREDLESFDYYAGFHLGCQQCTAHTVQSLATEAQIYAKVVATLVEFPSDRQTGASP